MLPFALSALRNRRPGNGEFCCKTAAIGIGGSSALGMAAIGRTFMQPVLRLYEDVLSNGSEASLPALPRMFFVVHGSGTIADRLLGDGDTFNSEPASVLKA